MINNRFSFSKSRNLCLSEVPYKKRMALPTHLHNINKYTQIWNINLKKSTALSSWLIVSCIFKMGRVHISYSGIYSRKQPPVFCNHVLTLTAHFTPKTNQYLKQSMTLLREKAAPLMNFKVISDYTKVFSLFHDHYPDFVPIKIFHGKMDHKVWNKILPVHLL